MKGLDPLPIGMIVLLEGRRSAGELRLIRTWNASALFGRNIVEVTLDVNWFLSTSSKRGGGRSRGRVTLISNVKTHDQLHAPAAATPGKNPGTH